MMQAIEQNDPAAFVRAKGGSKLDQLVAHRQANPNALILEREGGKVGESYYLDADERKRGILTGGVGHVLTANEMELYPEGAAIPEWQIDKWFSDDTAWSVRHADKVMKDIGSVNVDLRRVIESMSFQLGAGWPADFEKAYPALKAGIKSGNFDTAVEEFIDSKWFRQSPSRVRDIVEVLQTL
jgi:hypothetical protein